MKREGAPSWEASPGASSPSGLLSGLAKSHELASWRRAFKAGLRPPWQAPQSRLALPVPGSLYRAFVHTPQWGQPWKRLTQAQWEPSGMTLEAGPLGWASETEARWPGRSRPARMGREGAGKLASVQELGNMAYSCFYKAVVRALKHSISVLVCLF